MFFPDEMLMWGCWYFTLT